MDRKHMKVRSKTQANEIRPMNRRDPMDIRSASYKGIPNGGISDRGHSTEYLPRDTRIEIAESNLWAKLRNRKRI
jgi:hypothetical protein